MKYRVTLKVEYQVAHIVEADTIEEAMEQAKRRTKANAKAMAYSPKQFSDCRVMEMKEPVL